MLQLLKVVALGFLFLVLSNLTTNLGKRNEKPSCDSVRQSAVEAASGPEGAEGVCERK